MNTKSDSLPLLSVNKAILYAKIERESSSSDLLKTLREKRSIEVRKERKLENTARPRFVPDTTLDRASFAAIQRERVKAYTEALRSGQFSTAAHSSRPNKKEKQIFQSEFNLSSYTFSEPKNLVNLAFKQYMGLDDDMLHSGELENPEELHSLMPERKQDEKAKLEDSKLGSILKYSLPKAKSTTITLPPLPQALYTEHDKQMEQKHQKLLTKIKIPQQLSHTALVPIGQKKSPVSESKISVDEPSSSNFWIDFEILLERQFQFENEALSNLGRIENDRQNLIAMSRFHKSEISSLIWNLFLYLTQAKERLISLEDSKKICEIMKITCGGNQSKCIFELKNYIAGFERSRYLEFKSIAGHIRRIALASTESKVGMHQLVRKISSFISPLVFESRFEFEPVDENTIIRPLSNNVLDEDEIQPETPPNDAPKPWMETDDNINENWKTFSNDYVENILLHSELPLNWNSAVIDLLVRYFDQVFKI